MRHAVHGEAILLVCWCMVRVRRRILIAMICRGVRGDSRFLHVHMRLWREMRERIAFNTAWSVGRGRYAWCVGIMVARLVCGGGVVSEMACGLAVEWRKSIWLSGRGVMVVVGVAGEIGNGRQWLLMVATCDGGGGLV